jgi:hypothetical protein
MQHSTQLVGLVAFLGFVLTTACGEDDYKVTEESDGSGGARACIAGAREVCTGADDCTGLRECNDSGTAWGPCECGEGLGGSPGVGGADPGGLGGAAGATSGGAAGTPAGGSGGASTAGSAGASAVGSGGAAEPGAGGTTSAGGSATSSGGNGGEAG